MNNRVDIYLNSLSNFDLINKFFYENAINIPKMKHLNIVFSIRNLNYDQSKQFLQSSDLLNLITGHKPFLKKYKVFMKIRNIRQLCFLSKITLRRYSLLN